MNLYELNLAFNNLLEVLENTEDEITKDLVTNSLNEIKMQTTEKIENIIKYIKNLESETVAIETEVKRLQQRKKATENKINRLKEYLKDFTSTTENKKYNTGLFTLSVRKNAPSVNVVDLKAIPNTFIKKEVVETVDKAAIKKAIKDGQEVSGVELIQSESILIK